MKRRALWFVVAADIGLAALLTPTAFYSFAHRNYLFPDVPASFGIFCLCLSTITPLFIFAATGSLIKHFSRRQTPNKNTSRLHRFAFWAIFLEAAANFLLSFFMESDRHLEFASFVNGVVLLFTAGLAFINYSVLQHQSWLERTMKP